MEAASVGLLMLSACVFRVLLEHPASPLNQWIEDPLALRALRGLTAGATAIAIICTPWGQRAGGHMNPAMTLSYWMLGKVAGWDTMFYVAAQFAGGVSGVALADVLIGLPLRHTAVNYAVTAPGPLGAGRAFAAELAISVAMMWVLLRVSNSARLTRWTPYVAGALLTLFVVFESPYSGSSMNPARTFGSAFLANEWTALWVYFTAPVLGMLAAAAWYRARRGTHRVFCAKLHHWNNQPCIFRCRFSELA
jgi:aquaporin Z